MRINPGTVGERNLNLEASNDARETEVAMDFAFVGLIVAFFALSAGLVRFCERLMGKGGRS